MTSARASGAATGSASVTIWACAVVTARTRHTAKSRATAWNLRTSMRELAGWCMVPVLAGPRLSENSHGGDASKGGPAEGQDLQPVADGFAISRLNWPGGPDRAVRRSEILPTRRNARNVQPVKRTPSAERI